MKIDKTIKKKIKKIKKSDQRFEDFKKGLFWTSLVLFLMGMTLIILDLMIWRAK